MISIEQLNRIRKAKKVTNKALAKHLGLSRQQCTNLLTGISKIRVDQLISACEYIGVDVSFTYK